MLLVFSMILIIHFMIDLYILLFQTYHVLSISLLPTAIYLDMQSWT